MVLIKEQQREREEEVVGGWYLEDDLATKLKYSKRLGLFMRLIDVCC